MSSPEEHGEAWFCPFALGDSRVAPGSPLPVGATSSKLAGAGGGVQGPCPDPEGTSLPASLAPRPTLLFSSSSSVSEARKENLERCSFSSISMRESRLLGHALIGGLWGWGAGAGR